MRNHSNFRLLIIIMTICCTGAKLSAQAGKNEAYFFSHKPFINPKIVKDLESWTSDSGEQVVAINLPESMGTNRYFGEFETKVNGEDQNPTVTYTNKEACADHDCPYGPPYFSYRLIGKTKLGVYVLLTKNGGDGSGVFTSLLLVHLNLESSLTYDKKEQKLTTTRQRGIIKRLTEIPLGDRYKGKISLQGDTIHIAKDKSRVQSGFFNKDTAIKIEY